MRTIAINGTSGFLGRNIIKFFSSDYFIVMIQRQDYYDKHKLEKLLVDVDIVINLAGYSISNRWRKINKRLIYSSRIETSEILVDAINSIGKPVFFISFSATGIYDSGHVHSEKSIFLGDNFLSHVCMDWEGSVLGRLDKRNVVTICRLGIVLDSSGGFLKKILPVFRIGLGAIMGGGNQLIPLVTLGDFLRALDFMIENEIKGIVNLVAPVKVSNIEFSQALAKVLKQPCFFRIPTFLLKFIFGEQSLLFLEGQYVIPEVLQSTGFQFLDTNLDAILLKALNK